MKANLRQIEAALFCLCALILLVVIPLMHHANTVYELRIAVDTAKDSVQAELYHPWYCISDYTLSVWGKYLCYSVLALSVDLLWGYTGLLSLGQALFFALGGYMLGMYLMLKIGRLGQYKSDLPDFMVFLGHTFLPWFWRPFHSFPFAVFMVFMLPGVLALVFGWLAFRSRIKGVYFSILTQALTFAGSLLFFRNDMVMGGNNGFTDFKFLLGADIRSPGTQRVLFICTAALLLAVYAFCRALTLSRFGLIQRAIRDSETRVLFSGYPAARFKLFIFVVSALIASLGGALYVPQVGIINPSEMTPDKSLEAVVWCAVGGRGTLVGPVIGAISVNWLKSWASHEHPEIWPILLGGLFIVVVVLMPGGIVGLPAQLRPWFTRKRANAAEPPPPSPQEPKQTSTASTAPEVTV